MTTINTARRAFLRGRRPSSGMTRYMPWAVGAFEDLCQRCDDCVKACGESIVVAGDGGYPTIDFARGGCTFCGDCADACGHKALDRGLPAPWSLNATIGESCLAARGITCRACGDACEVRAIRFQLQVGGRAMPSVESSLCNGCGSCIATCPIQVIQLKEAA